MRFLIKCLASFPLLFSSIVSAQSVTPDQLMGRTPYESPSCNLSDHHEFDFMEGVWDLKVLIDGKWVPGGFAHHRKILGGCAAFGTFSFENWGDFYKPLSGRTGYAAIVLSSYDQKARNWRQIWQDDMGGINLDVRGRKHPDGMRFVGHAPGSDGAELQRIEWKVVGENMRQFSIDLSTDGGKEWTQIAMVQMIRRVERQQ